MNTNRTEHLTTDKYEIVLDYTFASRTYFIVGDIMNQSTDITEAKSGLTYQFDVLKNTSTNETNTIWIFVVPEFQTEKYSYLQFRYFINTTDPTGTEGAVETGVGIQFWHYCLVGIGSLLMGFIISCVVTRYILKWGIYKHKPWEINQQYYLRNDLKSHYARDQ